MQCILFCSLLVQNSFFNDEFVKSIGLMLCVEIHILYVCVNVCAGTHVSVFVCMCDCVYMPLWTLEGAILYLSQLLFALFLESESLTEPVATQTAPRVPLAPTAGVAEVILALTSVPGIKHEPFVPCD